MRGGRLGILAAGASAALFGTFGCSQGTAPVSAPASPPTKSVAKAPAEKLEVPPLLLVTTDDYTYNPVGKRDPFKRFSGDLVQDVSPQAPLERFDVGQLRVVAIVWGISSPRALVLAPDGQNYIVRNDTRVGKNRGRISRITRRELYVKEEYRDPTGKLVVQERSLSIRPKEEKLELRMSDE